MAFRVVSGPSTMLGFYSQVACSRRLLRPYPSPVSFIWTPPVDPVGFPIISPERVQPQASKFEAKKSSRFVLPALVADGLVRKGESWSAGSVTGGSATKDKPFVLSGLQYGNLCSRAYCVYIHIPISYMYIYIYIAY